MKNLLLISVSILFIFMIDPASGQVISDFETNIDDWYSEGDGDYLLEMGTGNPGNNFRVNDDATGDINLSYAPVKFLGDWSTATSNDSLSVDIFLHQINGNYIGNNYVFQIEGPGGKARAFEGVAPVSDMWEHYSVAIDPSDWTILEGNWNDLIQHVNELIVRMEYIDGDEWNRSDNVYLSFTPGVIPVVPVICSDFEEGGYDGWSFSGNGPVSNQSSGGHPGRGIRINNGSGTAVALAPPKFLGDWNQIDGHAAEIHVDLSIIDYSGNPVSGTNFIDISGPGGEATFPLSSDIAYAYDDWHTMTVPIDEADWTMVSGTWSALINYVTDLQLSLEYFEGSERVFMDNFCITDLPPVVDFDSDVVTLLPDNSVTFNDLSLNGPSDWSWDFGDSGTATDKNPVHIYTSPGFYDVTLTVSNFFGSDMITKTAYIEVLDDSQCTRYEDDFSASEISDVWRFRNGTWSLNSNGFLRQTTNYYVNGDPLGGCYGLVGSPYWQDYVLSCDFRSTDDDVIGFVFNYQDEQNMYMFYWDAQTTERILYKWENGTGTELAQDAVPYVSNQWYHAEISSIGGSLSVKIDGDEIFNVTDNTFTDGIVGLYCWANRQSQYDNFKLSCEGVVVDLTAFLEGPYESGEMNTTLKDSSLLPLAQPYSGSPWNYAGYENLDTIPDTHPVDWVLVELRDAPDAASALPATMVGQTAAFILNNGSVVDLNGSSPLRFTIDVQDQLFAVIRHRNHLAVMSANPLILSGGIYQYNFITSAGQAYGSDAEKDLGGGVFGLYSGDFNADGTIGSDDKSVEWMNNTGSGGYIQTDSNLDGQTDNLDKNDQWLNNIGKSQQYPQ